MSQTRRLLCVVYGAIALLALLATWHQNLQFNPAAIGIDKSTNGFAAFWLGTVVNPAAISITVDLFLLVFAAVIWMVIEARRVGVRFVWIYVVLSLLIAVSVMFPLFLIAREMRLSVRAEGSGGLQLKATDWLGYLLFGVPTVVFAVWTLVAK